MGIRGLLTYLHHHCPDACYKVNVADLISNESRRTGCRPRIVVDAPSCFSMWYRNLDWTIGLEVQELIHRLQSFVEAFDEMGADLTFFIGGLTPLQKRKTWLSRRITSLNQMTNVHDMLYAGKTYKEISEKLNMNPIPPNMANFVAFVLKHVLNCTVFVSVRDCDDEVNHYAKKNDCFAIFGYDSDFIVSQLKCLVLDANQYNCEDRTTVAYNRNKLCWYLRIKKYQLPLLAILAGNDYIDFETLRPFHYEICNWSPKRRHIPYKKLMTSIADYINNLPRGFSKKLMIRICEDVFKDSGKVDEMMRAYYAYVPCPTSVSVVNDQWSRILRVARVRLQTVLLPPSAWGVLSKRVYESSVCPEDLRKVNDSNEDDKWLPSATLTRNLRQRFYGVLLFENRNSNPIVREWCAENMRSYKKSVKVAPVYPRVHHPGLRALWDADRHSAHCRNKWKLFLEAVSPSIKDNTDEWMSLPNDLVASTATCYYLSHVKDFLTNKEQKATLITMAMFPLYTRSVLKKLKDHFQSTSMRARQISVTFSRTFSLVFSLMASCGFPVPLSEDTAHVKFEPVLFQYIYKRVSETKSSLKKLCNNDIKALNRYRQMEALMR